MLRNYSPTAFEDAIKNRLLKSARSKAANVLDKLGSQKIPAAVAKERPLPLGLPEELLKTAARPTQSSPAKKDLENVYLPSTTEQSGKEGSPDSISSWIKLSQFSSAADYSENLLSKMGFNIARQYINSEPQGKQLMLCGVLVNDIIKQVQQEKAKPISMDEETNSSTLEKSIRSAMEILVEKDSEQPGEEYAFSDLMMKLENFRRGNNLGYSTSWGAEDV
ncbi:MULTISPECIES: hypothetical protein [Pseudomonas]|uniref:Uncharacterized protein n=1 Tax=Pseudomonas quercus TaxID=2722792 RepID=A0ABX0YP10_9PSED|nr:MULTISPECIES: hypothetical protein [Pseudomonas]MBF7144979.1 hypothetical protein [Pseudomonas sp. LY10J]NJP03638.1 hypothetical protein [Pseudomonas quercus]